MIKSLLYIFLAIFLVSECECEKDSLTDYDGMGGITCEVNSTPFKSFDGFGRNNHSRLLDYDDGLGILISYTGSRNDSIAYMSLVLARIDTNNIIGRTFRLELQADTTGYTGNSSANFYQSYIRYNTTGNRVGELTVDFFDLKKRIVSGTFWFAAEDYNGNTINVENGFFDCSFY